MQHTQKATIAQITTEAAVLKLTSGATLPWPIKELPSEVKVGDTVFVSLRSEAKAADDEQAEARRLLNEILQSE
ncbi:hypothetical protein COV04_03260 [Candidatus Uhrbacteria bacterium CG10_big_fil_rev_8_21_14_0_10_48_11]|uniref:DUF3006 domain-containing protein n=1 Tax=Candidatus Uhrbacteria bacterium CG10_big_fil_rev_8_21_14_0_10_48_11 TaxID=1975037 RepID=A0A2M8LE79_9BACT|nr:MAG: hypothetical protein COV04_03260 [Candidatus Uhrbacteria bacterium CG10_big_fil_rev_8_21_14_0_10_48_11]